MGTSHNVLRLVGSFLLWIIEHSHHRLERTCTNRFAAGSHVGVGVGGYLPPETIGIAETRPRAKPSPKATSPSRTIKRTITTGCAVGMDAKPNQEKDLRPGGSRDGVGGESTAEGRVEDTTGSGTDGAVGGSGADREEGLLPASVSARSCKAAAASPAVWKRSWGRRARNRSSTSTNRGDRSERWSVIGI